MTQTNEQLVAVLLGEHTDKVLALLQAGFFEMKRGSVTAHFDGQGKIRKIEKLIVFDVVDVG